MGDNFKAYFIMIIFFTKTAELGKTKTRLKPYLNNEEILSISKRLISNQLDEIKKTGLDYRIYYSGEKPHDYDEGMYVKQEGDDLGQRMAKAFSRELKDSNKVLLLGSDLVGLDSKMIKASMDKPDTYNIVLVPTIDGGYGLVGMKNYYDIFSG